MKKKKKELTRLERRRLLNKKNAQKQLEKDPKQLEEERLQKEFEEKIMREVRWLVELKIKEDHWWFLKKIRKLLRILWRGRDKF